MTRRKAKSKSEYSKSMRVTNRTVNNWIERNPNLMNELKESGWKKTAKYWTPKQLVILDKHLK
jgi:hypothetical protein